MTLHPVHGVHGQQGGAACRAPRHQPGRWGAAFVVGSVGADTWLVTRTLCYREGVLCTEGFSLQDVSEHLAESSSVVWADLGAASLADLQLVAAELGLHSLAVEDATAGRERPKFDRYAGHEFLTAYAVHLDKETGALVTGEIAAFITPRALVTVRRDDEFPIDALVARWDEN